MYYYYYMLLYVNVFWARKIEIPFSTSHPVLVEYRCKDILKTLKFNATLQKNSATFPPPCNSTLSNQNCYGINNLQTRKTAFKFRDNGIYKSLIQKGIFSLQILLTEFYNKYQSATKHGRYLKTHHAFLSLCDSLWFVTRWGLQMNASRVRSL